MTEEYVANVCENFTDLGYVVYILRSQTNPSLTYCGMTNNIKRRLRQHNGHIKGGGKYTSANRPWHLAALVKIEGGTQSECKSLALKVEYWTKAKNYPINGIPGIRPAKRKIPTCDSVTRRVWLLRESLCRHALATTLLTLFDEEFKQRWDEGMKG